MRPPDLIRGMVVGVTMNRKWRRFSLKTLETDSKMADLTPSLTPGITMRVLSWRSGLGVTMNRKWRRNPLERLKMEPEMAEGRSRSRA